MSISAVSQSVLPGRHYSFESRFAEHSMCHPVIAAEIECLLEFEA